MWDAAAVKAKLCNQESTCEMVPCLCRLAYQISNYKTTRMTSSREYGPPMATAVLFFRVTEPLQRLALTASAAISTQEATPSLFPSIECSAEVQGIPYLRRTVVPGSSQMRTFPTQQFHLGRKQWHEGYLCRVGWPTRHTGKAKLSTGSGNPVILIQCGRICDIGARGGGGGLAQGKDLVQCTVEGNSYAHNH